MSNFLTNIRLNNLQQEIDNIVITGPLTNPLLKDMDCGGFGVDNAVFIQAASIITPSFTTTGIIADSVATDTITSKTSGGPVTFDSELKAETGDFSTNLRATTFTQYTGGFNQVSIAGGGINCLTINTDNIASNSANPIQFQSEANFTQGVTFSSITFDDLTVTDLATVGSLTTTKSNVQSNIAGSLYVAQDSLLGGDVKMSKDYNLYTSNIFASLDDTTETINVRNTLNVGNETVDESTITGLITVGVVDSAGNTSGTLRVSHIQPTFSPAGGDANSLQFEVTTVKFDDEIVVQGYGTFGGAINTPIVNTDKIQTNTLGQDITLVGVLQGVTTAIITGMSQIGGADIYGDTGSFTSIRNKENNGPPSLDFGLDANNHSVANASDIQLTLPASQDITIQANNINPSTGYPSLGLVWQHSGTNTSSVVYDTVFNVPPSVAANSLAGILAVNTSAGGYAITDGGDFNSASVSTNQIGSRSGGDILLLDTLKTQTGTAPNITYGNVFDSLVNPVGSQGVINYAYQNTGEFSLSTSTPKFALLNIQTPVPLANVSTVSFYMSSISFQLQPNSGSLQGQLCLFVDLGNNNNLPYNASISPVYLDISNTPIVSGIATVNIPSGILVFENPGSSYPVPNGLSIWIGIGPQGGIQNSSFEIANLNFTGTVVCTSQKAITWQVTSL